MTDYITPRDAATYTKRHYQTVISALQECVRTNGRSGLNGHQGAARRHWRTTREDVDRWVRGESPARGTRKFRVA